MSGRNGAPPWTFLRVWSQTINQSLHIHKEKFTDLFYSKYSIAQLFREEIDQLTPDLHPMEFLLLELTSPCRKINFNTGTLVYVNAKEMNTAENAQKPNSDKTWILKSYNALAKLLDEIIMEKDILLIWGGHVQKQLHYEFDKNSIMLNSPEQPLLPCTIVLFRANGGASPPPNFLGTFKSSVAQRNNISSVFFKGEDATAVVEFIKPVFEEAMARQHASTSINAVNTSHNMAEERIVERQSLPGGFIPESNSQEEEIEANSEERHSPELRPTRNNSENDSESKNYSVSSDIISPNIWIPYESSTPIQRPSVALRQITENASQTPSKKPSPSTRTSPRKKSTKSPSPPTRTSPRKKSTKSPSPPTRTSPRKKSTKSPSPPKRTSPRKSLSWSVEVNISDSESVPPELTKSPSPPKRTSPRKSLSSSVEVNIISDSSVPKVTRNLESTSNGVGSISDDDQDVQIMSQVAFPIRNKQKKSKKKVEVDSSPRPQLSRVTRSRSKTPSVASPAKSSSSDKNKSFHVADVVSESELINEFVHRNNNNDIVSATLSDRNVPKLRNITMAELHTLLQDEVSNFHLKCCTVQDVQFESDSVARISVTDGTVPSACLRKLSNLKYKSDLTLADIRVEGYRDIPDFMRLENSSDFPRVRLKYLHIQKLRDVYRDGPPMYMLTMSGKSTIRFLRVKRSRREVDTQSDETTESDYSSSSSKGSKIARPNTRRRLKL